MFSDTFTFHPTLVLRTPALSFNQEISHEALREHLLEPNFGEALYLASPSLYQESRKWLAGEIKSKVAVSKLVSSLAKYLNRSRSRCTPFGRFASSSVVQWQRTSAISLGAERQRTRLDMGFLRTLTQQLSEHPLIRKHLRYYPNSSWYTIGDEVRYVEYSSQAGRRTYQISSVASSEDLQQILRICSSGLAYAKVVDDLVSRRITYDDATQFVDELIDAQLLVSELEPTVTGTDPLHQVLSILERVNRTLAEAPLDPLIIRLKNTEKELLLTGKLSVSIQLYQHIEEQIRALQIPSSSPTLFQVNTFRQAAPGTLDQRWQGRIKQAIEVLTHLTRSPKNERLEKFRRQFYDRYEEAAVPLLSVLDTETGIRYGDMGQGVSNSLIDGLVSSHGDTSAFVGQRSVAEQWLLQKIRREEGNGKGIIRINAKEVKFLTDPDYTMPPSCSVLFRLVNRSTVYLEGVSGTSAANLLGRFANDDETIYQVVREITKTEQKNNPDVILAEIAHLPGQRVGNILRRPVLRDYELPYLAQSTRPEDRQIALQDLWVAVRDGRITLRSKRLDKEIIPRLSTAHNYTSQSLPVYQFLCDLQSQGIHRSLGLNWHPSHYGVKQLPRLSYDRIILGLKTWYLPREDFQDLFSEPTAAPRKQMEEWVARWKLPQYFVLVEGDRELLVDTQNSLMVRVWQETIKKQSAILLKEFLFDPKESVVTDQAGSPYVNQWIASVVKEGPTYSSVSSRLTPTTSAQRSFTLGSEWLYYKLYSGTRSSDKILVEAIYPLIESLFGHSLVDRWFFIRYADPDDHLRVRFHLTDTSQLGHVVDLMNQHIHPFEESGHVWKSHTDTYRREIERYGTTTIELSERYFCHDSQHVLATIARTQQDESRSQRWLAGVVTLDRWLNWFGYDLSQKYRFVQAVRERFYREFTVDKSGRQKINTRYRAYRDHIADKLQTNDQEDTKLEQLITRIKRARTAETPLDRLVGSYIHMHINRLIPADQRLHELIIYDFLARHYKSTLARR